MFVPLTPLRCLHRAADLFGSRVGVVCGDLNFTYAELKRRAEEKKTGALGTGLGGFIQRPKADDVALAASQRRVGMVSASVQTRISARAWPP